MNRLNGDLTVIGTDAIDLSANAAVTPSLTSFADGSYAVAYLVWTGSDPSGADSSTDMRMRVVSATGAVGPEFIVYDAGPGNVFDPGLATLSNGNFVAAFADDGLAINSNILFQIFRPDATAVTGPTLVFGATGPEQERMPSVAALRDGGFVVAWSDGSTGVNSEHIAASIYDNAGHLAAGNIRVNTTNIGGQIEPNVIALADGGFLVSWVSEDPGSADAVRAQRFDAAGNLVGPELLVRSGLTPVEGGPEAALLTSGRFAYAVGNAAGADTDVMTSIWDFGPLPAMDLSGDVFWRHVIDGDVATTDNPLGVVPLTWSIEGAGDFDADGDNDILWRHVDGLVVTWELEGGRFVTNHNLPSVSGEWRINGVGDFDSDGDADILWRHSDGTVVTWEMQDGQFVTNHNIGSASNEWRIEGVANLDGDHTRLGAGKTPQGGDSDILWRHADGAVVIWEMEDGAYVTNHNIETVPASWQIQLVGDFDRDGDGDILWRHSEGETVTWEMEAGGYLAAHDLGVVSATWRATVADDFDADGDADILWRHQDGDVVSWEMEAGAYVVNHNLGIVPAGWQISATGDAFAVPAI